MVQRSPILHAVHTKANCIGSHTSSNIWASIFHTSQFLSQHHIAVNVSGEAENVLWLSEERYVSGEIPICTSFACMPLFLWEHLRNRWESVLCWTPEVTSYRMPLLPWKAEKKLLISPKTLRNLRYIKPCELTE